MGNTVKIGTAVLGEGMPKICVPLVDADADALLTHAALCRDTGADLVEWRIDWFDGVFDSARFLHTLRALADRSGGLPILLTFRTKAQGGQRDIAPDAYQALLQSALETGCVGAVDIELTMPEAVVTSLIAAAHGHQAAAVLSHHDFKKTPAPETLVGFLGRMEHLGADVAKIAVMPQSAEDVLALLTATAEARRTLSCPVITMSMGGQGLVSRLSGELFGSCLTFGALGQASAPGQIDAGELKQILGVMHRALS